MPAVTPCNSHHTGVSLGTIPDNASSVVLFSLLAGGFLLRIPGALLAFPVAASFRMLIEGLRIDLPEEDALSASV